MSRFTEEELMAYADGELPAARAAEIAGAERSDSAVAAKIAAFRDSRRVLRDAFASQLKEAVPQRLLDVLNAPSAKVVEFKPRRARLSTWIPLAAAASVALAVGLTLNHRWSPAGPAPVVIANATMLNQALETLPSGVPLQQGGKEVLPLASLRTPNGNWCREFESRGDGAKSRGLACRDDAGQWQLRVIASPPSGTNPGQGGYQTASGNGPDLAATLGASRRLTPDEEQNQIHQHWHQ